MGIDVVIYQGSGPEYYGQYPFPPVLRRAAIHVLGPQANLGKLEFNLEEPLDEHDIYAGPPLIRNLTKRYGWCRLRLVHDGETVRDEHLRMVDLFGPVLADELRKREPEESTWAFRIRQRGVPSVIILGDKLLSHLIGEHRPDPEIEGAVDVNPDDARHRPFTLTPIAAPDTQVVRPEDLGLDPSELAQINVLISGEIHDQLTRDMPLSTRMEEGGFLLGRVAQTDDDVHLVEITHVTPAHRTGAGAAHFTFTPDSFLAAAKLIDERGHGELMVGWYHTHLSGVSMKMGLSSIDVDLHLATFQRPWQVAALINIRPDQRLLRFYGRSENKLQEYGTWISDDSGKYRRIPRAVGGE